MLVAVKSAPARCVDGSLACDGNTFVSKERDFLQATFRFVGLQRAVHYMQDGTVASLLKSRHCNAMQSSSPVWRCIFQSMRWKY